MNTLPGEVIVDLLDEHAEAIRAAGKRVIGDVIEVGRRLCLKVPRRTRHHQVIRVPFAIGHRRSST
ncbi:MAG: hypothetical protein WAK55_22770 [Xanthobacteraceae bacterium]